MEKDHQDNDVRKLEREFRELLQKANVSFITPAGVQAQESPETEAEEEPHSEEEALTKIREFHLKPRDISEYLDRFVVRQEDAKKALSVAICDHYNHVRRCIEDPSVREADYAKHNIVLLGPTGVGKTYLVRCISRLIGVPFVKADATKFSETGYVGHDVEDLVRDLVKTANGNTDLARYGIIFVDEIDKIAAQSSGMGRDVSGRGVQINLLKLMEETDVSLFSQTDLIGQMQAIMELQRGRKDIKKTLNTRHILFIVSGAFDQLGTLVERRLRASQIGFSGRAHEERKQGETLRLAQTQDFVSYGFEPEFIGRLPVRVVCDSLGVDDLEDILLHAEQNILSQYTHDFEGYGICFNVDRSGIRAIAEQAYGEKTGARGLMTVLERVFREFKFQLPSTDIRTFDVNEEVVKHGEARLREMVSERQHGKMEGLREELEGFAEDFGKEHGIKLSFTSGAAALITRMAQEEGLSIRKFWQSHFHDFEYGVRLIVRNGGKKQFRVTKKLVETPGEELSRRIAATFREEEET